MDHKIKELIDNEINNNDVCLFMKGTPDVPQCGFSMAVCNILKLLDVKLLTNLVISKRISLTIISRQHLAQY